MKSNVTAAAVALLVHHIDGVKNVVLAGWLVEIVPDVLRLADKFVTRYPTSDPLGAAKRVSSYMFVVLTGKFVPNAIMVGAVPVTLCTKFQLPELTLIAMPILPGVVFVVGSTFVGFAAVSCTPANTRLLF